MISTQESQETFDGQQIQNEVPDKDMTQSLQDEGEIKITSVSELADRPDLIQKAENPDAKWFVRPGVPGEGEPPEFYDEKLQQKYPSLEDMAKAVPGLRRTISEGVKSTAPEAYDFQTPQALADAGYQIDTEDPMFKGFSEVAREKGMSQEQFQGALDFYANNYLNEQKASQESEDQQSAAYIEEQMQKLGPNSNERINAVKTFIENSGIPEHARNVLIENIDSAEMVEAIEALRDRSNSSPIPGNISADAVSPVTRQELQEMLKNPLFGTNQKYTEEVQSKYAQLAEQERNRGY